MPASLENTAEFWISTRAVRALIAVTKPNAFKFNLDCLHVQKSRGAFWLMASDEKQTTAVLLRPVARPAAALLGGASAEAPSEPMPSWIDTDPHGGKRTDPYNILSIPCGRGSVLANAMKAAKGAVVLHLPLAFSEGASVFVQPGRCVTDDEKADFGAFEYRFGDVTEIERPSGKAPNLGWYLPTCEKPGLTDPFGPGLLSRVLEVAHEATDRRGHVVFNHGKPGQMASWTAATYSTLAGTTVLARGVIMPVTIK